MHKNSLTEHILTIKTDLQTDWREVYRDELTAVHTDTHAHIHIDRHTEKVEGRPGVSLKMLERTSFDLIFFFHISQYHIRDNGRFYPHHEMRLRTFIHSEIIVKSF